MFQKLKGIFTRADADWARYSQEASKKALFTPDLAELQQKETINIFLYNEMQTGQPNHGKLGPTAIYRGCGYTASSAYSMWTKRLGNETFPMALKIEDDHVLGQTSLIGDPGQIMGEVYTIRPFEIIPLDEYMLNCVYFERTPTQILVPFKTDPKNDKFDFVVAEAYMWTARRQFWDEQIADVEAKHLFRRVKRLFNAKSISEESLGSYYVFDAKVELDRG